MTIYEIGILTHYYCRCIDHDDLQRNTPVWRPTIDSFIEQGLLVRAKGCDMAYHITERGRVYVKALQRVPLPVSSWTIRWPEPETAVDESLPALPVVPLWNAERGE